MLPSTVTDKRQADHSPARTATGLRRGVGAVRARAARVPRWGVRFARTAPALGALGVQFAAESPGLLR